MKNFQIIILLAGILVIANGQDCFPVTGLVEFNPSTYCGDQVIWNISQNTVDNAGQLHASAQALYYSLYLNWNSTGGVTPSNDCLAIARQVICSSFFPICYDGVDYTQICSFLCGYVTNRCTSDSTFVAAFPNFYDQVCSNQNDTICSYGGALTASRLILAFMLLLVLSMVL